MARRETQALAAAPASSVPVFKNVTSRIRQRAEPQQGLNHVGKPEASSSKHAEPRAFTPLSSRLRNTAGSLREIDELTTSGELLNVDDARARCAALSTLSCKGLVQSTM